MSHGVTARRACELVQVSTSMLSYCPAPARNQRLKQRLCEVARPGTGYRTARLALLPEFGVLNHKRVYRLWKEAKLALKTKSRRKRTGAGVPLSAGAMNQVWCLDFCFDACLNGSRLKVLAVKDEFTRECLALEAATSMTSQGVRRVLQKLVAQRGAPKYVRSDNGPEFVARHLQSWLQEVGSSSHLIKPGSPWQNGHAESFMSRLRAEFLNAEVFYNVADARLKLGMFQKFYNERRPHSALGNVSPTEFASRLPQHISKSQEGGGTSDVLWVASEKSCTNGRASFSERSSEELKRCRKNARI